MVDIHVPGGPSPKYKHRSLDSFLYGTPKRIVPTKRQPFTHTSLTIVIRSLLAK